MFDVAQNHVVAAAGEDVGDAVAHGAAAEDGDGADVVQMVIAPPNGEKPQVPRRTAGDLSYSNGTETEKQIPRAD